MFKKTWIIDAVSKDMGIANKENRLDLISKYVYKYTSCGAWVKFDEQGVMVGTIVEGSDAEFSERIEVKDLLEMKIGRARIELLRRFYKGLDRCEEFAEEEFGKEEEEDFI